MELVSKVSGGDGMNFGKIGQILLGCSLPVM